MKAKILIVDDQPAKRQILIDALEPEGYVVLSAPSGEVALKIVPRATPDLVLLDIRMPGLDGFSVCRQLKSDAATKDIPVIFVTARDETEDVVQGFGVGSVDYIIKPFNKQEVLVRVQNHLRISGLTKALQNKNRELEAEIVRREQAEKARQQAEVAHQQVADALQRADEQLSIISQQEAKQGASPNGTDLSILL